MCKSCKRDCPGSAVLQFWSANYWAHGIGDYLLHLHHVKDKALCISQKLFHMFCFQKRQN